jgi:hypothetical protein
MGNRIEITLKKDAKPPQIRYAVISTKTGVSI